MTRVWQLQEAKAKLTEVINAARKMPQIISRHNVQEVVLISVEKYAQLSGGKETLGDFFKRSPLYGLDINLDRNKSMMREVDL